jgi:hypothetical protein
LTLVTLLLHAIDRVKTQAIFDRDPYESRRNVLPGSRLLKMLVFYQVLNDPSQRGLVRAVEEFQDAQRALGAIPARNTLSNALSQQSIDLMIEAWAMLLAYYRPQIAKMGRKFARIAAVDASLIKLSLRAFNWATYREQTGAAKITCVFDWVQGVPQQFVFTASGKVHDLKATSALVWRSRWTYLFDRGYFSFNLLSMLLDAGAHFVIRLKREVDFTILNRFEIPEVTLPAGMRALLSDWTIRLPGWDREVILRLMTYQLTDGKTIRVLTDRHDLCALSVAQLYKERWTIENWWRWLKRLYKVQNPLGRSENALPLQIVAAFITDLLFRVFKQGSGYKKSLYEFITTCRDMALVPVTLLGSLKSALLAVAKLLELQVEATTEKT